MRQMNLFGETVQDQMNPKSHAISIFHDESGDYGHGDWVLTGLFWINQNQIQELNYELKLIRDTENYNGKIHFKKFPKYFGGEYGSKARIAKEWFNMWNRKWSKKTWFNVVAVNRKHHNYDHKRFTRDFHAYNRFVAIAIKSGLSWFFKGYTKLDLSMYSDGKSRRPKGLIPDGSNSDNFEEYLVRKICSNGESYHGPKVALNNSVNCIISPSKGKFDPYQEILQFTDLLIGSVSEAIAPKSDKETKKWFAVNMAKIMKDLRQAPWEQKYDLHKKFSISYFPDDSAKFYNDGPIGIYYQMPEFQSKIINES